MNALKRNTKEILFVIFVCMAILGNAQDKQQRIDKIKNQLTILSATNKGLNENVKTDISVENITLSNFLLAISDVHHINMNVSPKLSKITIANNFTNVTVADLLVFLCKEYNLTIDFTGNILSISQYKKPTPPKKEKIIPITYFPTNNLISIDAKNDKLYDVFKKIMDKSGKNLVFSPGLEDRPMTAYIQKTPFKSAMEKLAFANNLYVEKTKDNFYRFEDNTPVAKGKGQHNQIMQRPSRRRKSNFYFKVLNPETKLLEVDFTNTPIADIIHDIGNKLNIDKFTASPLDNAGTASFKSKSITFDDLLKKIFSAQASNNQQNRQNVNANTQKNPQTGQGQSEIFTFKREDNTYIFGTKNQLSIRQVAAIPLVHRSIELLNNPSGAINNTNQGTMAYSNAANGYNNNGYQNNQFDNSYGNNNLNRQRTNNNNSVANRSNANQKKESLLKLIPDKIKSNLNIKIDYELNTFYVNGPSAEVNRFKQFVEKIDKLVPVVLIEVMIIEVSKNATIETGVSWGIGDEPKNTRGDIYPTTDLTLGAKTVNKLIGSFNSFGTFNLGKVVPNFFATIKAMESNGDLKIRSTPKLSTLNGHRATFSNGQTSYYAVTQRNIYGTDNPQTSEIKNYVPISADLGLNIKPIVSNDGEVTMDIFVIQSSFGSRIAEDAPPDINSRKFSSIIRVEDQDIVILGGLEEQSKDNSGNGVPFLSKIPIIKWLFSSRKRESSKSRLTVLIKPTIIR